jgi:hypothetical protein
MDQLGVPRYLLCVLHMPCSAQLLPTACTLQLVLVVLLRMLRVAVNYLQMATASKVVVLLL